MRKSLPRIILAFAICAQSASSHAADVKDVEVLWEGTYRNPFSKPPEGEPVPKIPLLGPGWIGPRPLRQTDVIPGVKRMQFGVLFAPIGIQGEVKNVKLRYITRFPEPGLMLPGSTKPVLFVESTIDCMTALACIAFYTFDNDFEIVPGNWKIEVYSGKEKLIDKTFKVQGKNGT